MSDKLQERAGEFDNLPPIQKLRAIGALELQEEENRKLKPIRADFHGRYYRIEEIICLGDEYQFVKTTNKKDNEAIYHVYVKYKRTNQCAYTLDSAIIVALCYKYDNSNSVAPIYIERMLNMVNEPEQVT